jgi:alkylhydroperoxidase family enzyme
MDPTRTIPPLSPEETLEIVQKGDPGVPFDERRSRALVYRTMGHNPALLNTWLPICDFFMNCSEISAFDRETLILRTGRHCDSEYEWAKHVIKADGVGLSEADVAAIHDVTTRPDDGSWLDTLLRLADELHATSTITDETFDRLSATYDNGQLMVAIMMVGEYHMLAYALNGARIFEEARA